MNKVCLILFFALSFSALSFDKVVYGEDDRLDLYQVTNSLHKQLALSTAAMIDRSVVYQDADDYYWFNAEGKQNLHQLANLCSDARFASQPAPASCSGFLIAPDLLVTAGHCIKNQDDCDRNLWFFGFGLSSSDMLNTDFKNNPNDVYSCVEIVERQLDRNTKNDFALIRLDRAVDNFRQPLKFRTNGKIPTDTKLLLIGHPSGLPTKVADNANIRDNTNPYYFITNTDSFGGNSGSAIFDARTGLVEGILVRGGTDYIIDNDKKCLVPQICMMNDCRGEDVTRITNIQSLVPPAITNLQISDIQSKKATVSWELASRLPISYRFEVALASTASVVPECDKLKWERGEQSVSLNNLQPEQEYIFTICTKTSFGYSKPTQKKFTTTKIAPLLSAPKLSSIKTAVTSVAIQLEAVAGEVVQEYSFAFFKSGEALIVDCSAMANKTKLSLFNGTKLQRNTDYVVAVCAKNTDGIYSKPSMFTFKTKNVHTPQSLIVNKVFANRVTYDFDTDSTSGTQYIVSIALGANAPLKCESDNVTSPSEVGNGVFTKLNSSTDYTIRVCTLDPVTKQVLDDSPVITFKTEALRYKIIVNDTAKKTEKSLVVCPENWSEESLFTLNFKLLEVENRNVIADFSEVISGGERCKVVKVLENLKRKNQYEIVSEPLGEANNPLHTFFTTKGLFEN